MSQRGEVIIPGGDVRAEIDYICNTLFVFIMFLSSSHRRIPPFAVVLHLCHLADLEGRRVFVCQAEAVNELVLKYKREKVHDGMNGTSENNLKCIV